MNILLYIGVTLASLWSATGSSFDIDSLINREAQLTYAVVRNLRDQLSVCHSLEADIVSREKRRTKRSHSERYREILDHVNEARNSISMNMKKIRKTRKLIKGASEADELEGISLIHEANRILDEILIETQTTMTTFKNRLIKERNGLFSRKLRLGDLIDESPKRIDIILDRSQASLQEIEKFSVELAEHLTYPPSSTEN
jgi:hypothetical protein